MYSARDRSLLHITEASEFAEKHRIELILSVSVVNRNPLLLTFSHHKLTRHEKEFSY